ncbi:hypothetical protein QR680_003718 [Steinernema hermaphroditum]|uniref:Uncharacterized protein n=1 Tax=Steinernema hermaphroditum TaxID=289476 RepID=A0AA39HLB7_9BILA|nr:hypothetical protein QR680_003718 [Steinernema hermaphroditum]
MNSRIKQPSGRSGVNAKEERLELMAMYRCKQAHHNLHSQAYYGPNDSGQVLQQVDGSHCLSSPPGKRRWHRHLLKDPDSTISIWDTCKTTTPSDESGKSPAENRSSADEEAPPESRQPLVSTFRTDAQ